MQEKKYNGWTNYATWRINIEIWYGYDWENKTFENISDLTKRLEEQTDEVLTDYGENETGLALDYARAFVSDVNWYEIAQHFIDENKNLVKNL